MQVNAIPPYDPTDNPTGCCPRFHPEAWENQELTFDEKPFVRASTVSAFHVPLNMGSVFTKTWEAIRRHHAEGKEFLVLSHDDSAWHSEHLFAVDHDVPGAVMAHLSGTFLTKVFEGADTTLLAATAGVVAILLLITYRSPWLWLVPLVVVGVAEQLTTRLVALLAPQFGIVVGPEAAGITSVLVFGAATDYVLLLIARYRDRLRQDDSRFHAMQVALRRTSEAIIASAATVTLALLTLLLAQQESLRGIGFSSAVGVVVAAVFGLFVLPAAMVVFGRGLFWPFVPRVGDQPREGRFWGRIGELVQRRPNIVGIGASLVLVVMALGSIGVSVGLSQNEQFRVKPEAVPCTALTARWKSPVAPSRPTLSMLALARRALVSIWRAPGCACGEAG